MALGLEETTRQEAARWYALARGASAAARLQVGGGHLPEPFAGWGDGDQPSVLVLGQNPGSDPKELLPDATWTEDAYHAFYWRRFARDRDAQGQIISHLQGGRTKRIPHYNRIEALLSPGSLGTQVLYIDAVPWKGPMARLGMDDGSAETIGRERVARFLPGLRALGGEPHVITLGNPATICAAGDPGWQPLTPTWQRVRFTHGATDLTLRLLAIYHPSHIYQYLPTQRRQAYLLEVQAAYRNAIGGAH